MRGFHFSLPVGVEGGKVEGGVLDQCGGEEPKGGEGLGRRL